jgi:predicted HAD superfamily Cof-like phosphohydrolase
MSKDWTQDIHEMHNHYGIHEAMKKLSKPELKAFLRFRVNFLKEELTELQEATKTDIPIDAEETVDALIDLCVVAIGTLDLFDVDGHKAWNEVLAANMLKMVGVKETRPNPYGLPDLIKPEGWQSPNHKGNHGNISGL